MGGDVTENDRITRDGALAGLELARMLYAKRLERDSSAAPVRDVDTEFSRVYVQTCVEFHDHNAALAMATVWVVAMGIAAAAQGQHEQARVRAPDAGECEKERASPRADHAQREGHVDGMDHGEVTPARADHLRPAAVHRCGVLLAGVDMTEYTEWHEIPPSLRAALYALCEIACAYRDRQRGGDDLALDSERWASTYARGSDRLRKAGR